MLSQWIQSFQHRELLLRRYYDESRKDPFIRQVFRTPDVQAIEDLEKVKAFKEKIIMERAIPIQQVLDEINQRKLQPT